MTKFALRGSVINEAWHVLAAYYSARSAIDDAFAGQFGGGFVVGVVALVVNLALVALQRYNRARTVRTADRLLARGHGFRSDYRNWAGLDQQALRRYHANDTPKPGVRPPPPPKPAGCGWPPATAWAAAAWSALASCSPRRTWSRRSHSTRCGSTALR